MAAQHRYGVEAEAVDTDHGGVRVLVGDAGGDGAHANAHGPDEYESVEVVPALVDVLATDDFSLELGEQQTGDVLALLADLYDGYFLHFRMVIG